MESRLGKHGGWALPSSCVTGFSLSAWTKLSLDTRKRHRLKSVSPTAQTTLCHGYFRGNRRRKNAASLVLARERFECGRSRRRSKEIDRASLFLQRYFRSWRSLAHRSTTSGDRGTVTATAATIAASNALPPCSMIRMPAIDASGSSEVTIACRPVTSGHSTNWPCASAQRHTATIAFDRILFVFIRGPMSYGFRYF